MKAAGRFGAQTPAGVFGHMQQQQQQQHLNLPHRTQQQQQQQQQQHHLSNPAGLPPPSFNQAFSQGNSNPFAVASNVNGLAAGFGANNGNGFVNGGTGLASREAQEGFMYGAQLQQQSQNKAHMRRGKGGSKGQQEMRIRDVWAVNLREEMDLLEQLIERYPYVSMDTEFPGIVARPMGKFTTKADYHYQCLRCNVDLLKVIQLGISLFDKDGNSPPANLAEIPELAAYANNLKPCPTTWQFNFQFSLDEDMYNDASIVFLQDAGIDLKRFESEGIDPEKFGSRLITSGMAHFDDVRWISFHSGYDFAYIVKLMNRNELPEDESEYRKLLKLYFPSIFDIKYMIQHAQRSQRVNNDQPLSPEASNHLNNLAQKGGLQHLADELHVRRVGHAHSAGSDALLTGKVFWEVKEKIFGGNIDDSRYLGQVWGLNIAGSGSSASMNDGQTPNLNGATIYHNPNNQAQQQQQLPPSTPVSMHAGPASTPGQQIPQSRDGSNSIGGLGNWTPGGGGGVFGAFRSAGRS